MKLSAATSLRVGDTAATKAYLGAALVWPAGLGAPQNVVAINYGAGLRTTWDAKSGAALYKVYRSTAESGSYVLLGSTGNLFYDDESSKLPSTPYWYKVTAVSGGDESEKSAAATATTYRFFDSFSRSIYGAATPGTSDSGHTWQETHTTGGPFIAPTFETGGGNIWVPDTGTIGNAVIQVNQGLADFDIRLYIVENHRQQGIIARNKTGLIAYATGFGLFLRTIPGTGDNHGLQILRDGGTLVAQSSTSLFSRAATDSIYLRLSGEGSNLSAYYKFNEFDAWILGLATATSYNQVQTWHGAYLNKFQAGISGAKLGHIVDAA